MGVTAENEVRGGGAAGVWEHPGSVMPVLGSGTMASVCKPAETIGFSLMGGRPLPLGIASSKDFLFSEYLLLCGMSSLI